MSNLDPSRAPSSAPVPDSLAGLRWRIDAAIADAATVRRPLQAGASSPPPGCHMRSASPGCTTETGTRAAWPRLARRAWSLSTRARRSPLTGGEVTHRDDENPAIIEANGWLPVQEAVPPVPRLRVRAWGALITLPGSGFLA